MSESREIVLGAIVRVLENIVLEGKSVSEESYFRDMGLDSLDMIEVAMDLEEELNIYIPDEKVEHVESVGDLTDIITVLYKHQIK